MACVMRNSVTFSAESDVSAGWSWHLPLPRGREDGLFGAKHGRPVSAVSDVRSCSALWSERKLLRGLDLSSS